MTKFLNVVDEMFTTIDVQLCRRNRSKENLQVDYSRPLTHRVNGRDNHRSVRSVFVIPLDPKVLLVFVIHSEEPFTVYIRSNQGSLVTLRLLYLIVKRWKEQDKNYSVSCSGIIQLHDFCVISYGAFLDYYYYSITVIHLS